MSLFILICPPIFTIIIFIIANTNGQNSSPKEGVEEVSISIICDDHRSIEITICYQPRRGCQVFTFQLLLGRPLVPPPKPPIQYPQVSQHLPGFLRLVGFQRLAGFPWRPVSGARFLWSLSFTPGTPFTPSTLAFLLYKNCSFSTY